MSFQHSQAQQPLFKSLLYKYFIHKFYLMTQEDIKLNLLINLSFLKLQLLPCAQSVIELKRGSMQMPASASYC